MLGQALGVCEIELLHQYPCARMVLVLLPDSDT
jgi:hypothetical protein